MSSYHTPIADCQATLIIKKSEFLGFGFAICSREQLIQHVTQLRQHHPNANHICYGYILGNPNNTTSAGFDDDGEPNGTAGKPILNVLQHKNIGNCGIVIVRYFGGIKLGAGGLTRAYGSTAQAVVEHMALRQFVATTTISILTTFANEAFVRHLIGSFNATIQNTTYTQKVQLDIQITASDVHKLADKMGIHGQILSQD